MHAFSVEGKQHPDIGEVYFELYQLVSEMRKLGYVPDTSCIIHNIGEEEKQKLLMGHTEKLAITYGLISTSETTAIRVIKNTKVCNDCHTVAKYASENTGREIYLRDGIRFHHFRGGYVPVMITGKVERGNYCHVLIRSKMSFCTSELMIKRLEETADMETWRTAISSQLLFVTPCQKKMANSSISEALIANRVATEQCES